MDIDHIQLAMPPGGEERARAFFGNLLMLPEMEKPVALRAWGGCWFRLGDRQLHMGVDPEFRPGKKAHVAFACPDPAGMAKRLVDAGFAVEDAVPIDGRYRFFTKDPFGNRLEFIEVAS